MMCRPHTQEQIDPFPLAIFRFVGANFRRWEEGQTFRQPTAGLWVPQARLLPSLHPRSHNDPTPRPPAKISHFPLSGSLAGRMVSITLSLPALSKPALQELPARGPQLPS